MPKVLLNTATSTFDELIGSEKAFIRPVDAGDIKEKAGAIGQYRFNSLENQLLERVQEKT